MWGEQSVEVTVLIVRVEREGREDGVGMGKKGRGEVGAGMKGNRVVVVVVVVAVVEVEGRREDGVVGRGGRDVDRRMEEKAHIQRWASGSKVPLPLHTTETRLRRRARSHSPSQLIIPSHIHRVTSYGFSFLLDLGMHSIRSTQQSLLYSLQNNTKK